MIHGKLLGDFLLVGMAAGIVGVVTHLMVSWTGYDKPRNHLDQSKDEEFIEEDLD